MDDKVVTLAYIVLAIVTNDRQKKQKPTKAKCKRDESITKQSIFVELLVFSVTPFKIDQNTNQNLSIDKV